MTRSAVAVVSGGLDSVTLAYGLALGWPTTDRDLEPVHDLTIVSVDYGQKHRRELEYAALAATRLNADHIIVDLSGLAGDLTSALTTGATDVPEGHYAADSMKATVVPNRNAILASIAYGIGVSRGVERVALGVHVGDHTIYPDCRPEFIGALNTALRLGSSWTAETPTPYLVAPFSSMTKTDIAKMAGLLDVPIADTWSCYVGGDIHCGRCGTCVERQEALHDAGVDDPTVYADPTFWRQTVGA